MRLTMAILVSLLLCAAFACAEKPAAAVTSPPAAEQAANEDVLAHRNAVQQVQIAQQQLELVRLKLAAKYKLEGADSIEADGKITRAPKKDVKK